MKRTFLLLTLGAILTCPSFAQVQDSTNAPPPGPPPGEDGPGGHHDHLSFLTDAEKAELKKAHEAAVAADPSLATEEKANWDAMKAAHESGTPPTEEQKAQFRAFREKMDAAMVAADPAVAPILAKIKAHHHGHDGPPPPPPADAPSAN
jgi:Spy/CpxP family protein refolding chaperone